MTVSARTATPGRATMRRFGGHPQLIQQPGGVSSGHGDIDVVGVGDADTGILQQGQPRQRVEQEVAVVDGGVVGAQRDQGAPHPLDLGSACPVRKALGATTPEGGVLEQHAIPAEHERRRAHDRALGHGQDAQVRDRVEDGLECGIDVTEPDGRRTDRCLGRAHHLPRRAGSLCVLREVDVPPTLDHHAFLADAQPDRDAPHADAHGPSEIPLRAH